MATTAMISGAMGLPFVNAFAGVYNMLTKDEDAPSDIRIDAQNGLASMFGQGVGQVISHGLPKALGLDSATFGLQDLLPGSEFLSSRRLLKDRFADQANSLLGPALNAGIDVSLGLGKISDGYLTQGLVQMLPSGLKPYFKAYGLAKNGFTDGKGNKIALEATPWDVIQQGFGFQPGDRATFGEASRYVQANRALLADRRAIISDQVYKAVTGGDPQERAEALQAMRDFNAKNPTAPIRGIQDVFRKRAQDLAIGRASGSGVTGAPNQLPVLRQQLRFAIPENAALPAF